MPRARVGVVLTPDQPMASVHPGYGPPPSALARLWQRLKPSQPGRGATRVQGLSMPVRTWLLIGLTVAALMVVMFTGGDESEAPATPPPRQPTAQGAASRPGQASGAHATAGGDHPAAESAAKAGDHPAADTGDHPAAESTAKAGDHPAAESAAKAGDHPAAESTAKAGDHPAAESTADTGDHPATPPTATVTTAQGTNLLMAGREREALGVYQELARLHPDKPVNAAIVKILKRRLAERCKDTQPGEAPCPSPP